MDALAEWFYSFVNTPWAPIVLLVHSFLESSFLPGAHDFFLIAVSLVEPGKSFFFALFSTVGSALGGCFAYVIGRFGGRPLLVKIFHEERVDLVEKYFQKYGVLAVGVAGFTPLPYKLFAIAAGIFELPLGLFFLVSLFTRAMRFFLVSGVLYVVGPAIKDNLIHVLNLFSIVCVIAVIPIIFGIRAMKKKEGRTKL